MRFSCSVSLVHDVIGDVVCVDVNQRDDFTTVLSSNSACFEGFNEVPDVSVELVSADIHVLVDFFERSTAVSPWASRGSSKEFFLHIDDLPDACVFEVWLQYLIAHDTLVEFINESGDTFGTANFLVDRCGFFLVHLGGRMD